MSQESKIANLKNYIAGSSSKSTLISNLRNVTSITDINAECYFPDTMN